MCGQFLKTIKHFAIIATNWQGKFRKRHSTQGDLLTKMYKVWEMWSWSHHDFFSQIGSESITSLSVYYLLLSWIKCTHIMNDFQDTSVVFRRILWIFQRDSIMFKYLNFLQQNRFKNQERGFMRGFLVAHRSSNDSVKWIFQKWWDTFCGKYIL